jgi:hypothetical protein
MKFSRNISPDNEKEKMFDLLAEKICQLILNDSREFSHKVMILIRKNIESTNLKIISDFISQNFNQINENNEKQFMDLELKITFEYRHNVLQSLRVDLLELEKIFNPYEILDWEFECFVPLLTNLRSENYSFVFNFIFNTFKNPIANNFKFLKILKDLKNSLISENFDVNNSIIIFDNYIEMFTKIFNTTSTIEKVRNPDTFQKFFEFFNTKNEEMSIYSEGDRYLFSNSSLKNFLEIIIFMLEALREKYHKHLINFHKVLKLNDIEDIFGSDGTFKCVIPLLEL